MKLHVRTRPKINLNKRLKQVLIVALPLFGIAAALLFVRAANGPAQGTIKAVTYTQAQTPKSQPVTFRGSAIAFTYDSDYEFKTVQESKLYTEQYQLSKPARGLAAAQSLSLAVRPLHTASADEDSGYQVRKKDTANYDLSKQRVGTATVEVFALKSGSYEKTAFWINDNRLLTVSLTSGTTSHDGLHKEFQSVLESIVWQEEQ